MMKSLAIHGALALVGLGWAYMVWTEGEVEETNADEVQLVACEPERLREVKLESERRDVTIARRGQGADRAWWVSVVRKPEGGEETTVEFVANQTIDDYLGTIAPFKALRSLGEVENDVLEELEIGDDSATIVYDCGGRESRYRLGGSTFGSGDRYVQKSDGGAVYLLAADVIRGLESAEFQLMQRELHRFEMTEVARLEVEAFGQRRELMQRDHRNAEQAEWVDAAEPARRNELYGNWLQRVVGLRVQSYLASNARPGSDVEGESAAPETVMTLVWKDADGEEIGRMELVKLPLERPVYYARTETTRAWVRVIATTAEEVENDARPVVGLPPIERPPAPEAPAPGVPGMPAPLEPLAPLEPAEPSRPMPLPPGHP